MPSMLFLMPEFSHEIIYTNITKFFKKTKNFQGLRMDRVSPSQQNEANRNATGQNPPPQQSETSPTRTG